MIGDLRDRRRFFQRTRKAIAKAGPTKATARIPRTRAVWIAISLKRVLLNQLVVASYPIFCPGDLFAFFRYCLFRRVPSGLLRGLTPILRKLRPDHPSVRH